MNILTLKRFCLDLPKEIREELHLKADQKVTVETTKDKTILIRPLSLDTADTKLLRILRQPVRMGKIKYQKLRDIYNDID